LVCVSASFEFSRDEGDNSLDSPSLCRISAVLQLIGQLSQKRRIQGSTIGR
jgi:hypothetical protein